MTLASAGRGASRASVPDPSTSVGRIVSIPEGFRTAKASGVSDGVALTSRRYAGGSKLGSAPVNSVVSSIDGSCAAERTFGESRVGEDASAALQLRRAGVRLAFVLVQTLLRYGPGRARHRNRRGRSFRRRSVSCPSRETDHRSPGRAGWSWRSDGLGWRSVVIDHGAPPGSAGFRAGVRRTGQDHFAAGRSPDCRDPINWPI